MIAATAYTPDGPRVVDDPATISDVVGNGGTVVWVDLVEPTEDDLRCVQQEFCLHPLAMEDAVKHGQRPKLERYPSSSPPAATTAVSGDGAGASAGRKEGRGAEGGEGSAAQGDASAADGGDGGGRAGAEGNGADRAGAEGDRTDRAGGGDDGDGAAAGSPGGLARGAAVPGRRGRLGPPAGRETHAFLVAYSANLVEVDLFVGPGWLVSVRAVGEDGRPWSIDGVRHRFEGATPEQATSGFLLYTILDELVDGYFVETEAIEDRLEDLEDLIFVEGADERVLQRDLYTLRRELLAFRRRVQPLRETLAALLRREVEWVDELTLTHLQDVYDHVLRVVDQIDSHRELMGNAVEAQLALMSNRMNRVMKKMTSWGAILLGSTLVAGIYGMNFEHMPELGWRLGYAFALGVMVTLTVVLYALFRRRDWL